MFRLRPYRGVLIGAIFVAFGGGLITAFFYMEDSWNPSGYRWVFSLAVTVILVSFLLIIAFSRYRFNHLRHHRPGYKRG